MLLGPAQDQFDTTVNPNERLQSLFAKILKRRKSISPNPAEGFHAYPTDGTSDATSSTAPGIPSGQN